MDFGNKDQNKKFKEVSVLKPSSKRGYIWVNVSYLLIEHDWIKNNSKLSKVVYLGNVSKSVYMVGSLISYMFQRKKPLFCFKSEREYKRWILLRKDHWLIDHDVRVKLLAEGKI